MPSTDIDGITTHYDVVGAGPPLLMFSPGGFNATLDNWTELGVYRRIKPIEHLSRAFTCIAFDRREAGRSGGRVERITWADYAAQGRGLLDHLGIDKAHLMGGCQGCSPVTAFAVAYPDVVSRMVLYWPAGGPRYRISGHARFVQHLAYVRQDGLAGITSLAKATGAHFGQDPRVGPWATVLRHDDAFAAAYGQQDPDRYAILVAGMARTLLDRDTVAGAEPEDLLQLDIPALVVPGSDDSHATSAARYLAECLSKADYWDVPVSEQTAQAVSKRIRAFLQAAAAI